MDDGTAPPLSIGDLAARTGVPVGTLRSWEQRYGFPRGHRQPGGHRRFAEADAEAVLTVLERRRAGLSLTAAIRAVAAAPVRSGSLFAELRRRHPVLRPQTLGRDTLVALSHGIEDECCARAADPVLFGGFQRERFLRASHRRWADLALTARSTVVFAVADEVTGPEEPGLMRIALPLGSPLHREWFVVCDAEDLPACIAAVERPGQDSGERTFESVWSVDPVVVRDAGRIAAQLADDLRPDWRDGVDPTTGFEPVPASEDLHRAELLFDRFLQYLDARRPAR